MCHPGYFVNLDMHPTKINHLGSPKISLEALDKASSKKSREANMLYI